jgi:hypothetical protein
VDKLDKLSEKQDKAENEKKSAVKQKAINSDFKKFRKNLKI